jgi:hypothetical protein
MATCQRKSIALRLALAVIVCPAAAFALTLGQTDTFQDGSSQGWQTGAGSIPNIATGGPGGAGDRYIQYSSTGTGGANSRLIIFNSAQWLGDYIGAGITRVEMDLNNFSAPALSIRLAFFLDPGTGYVSTTPFALAGSSGWQHAGFDLVAGNFTAIGSPGDFATLLSDFNGQLRILHSGSPALLGDTIAATVGFDNIQAVPEPGALALTGVALLLLVGCCRRLRC